MSNNNATTNTASTNNNNNNSYHNYMTERSRRFLAAPLSTNPDLKQAHLSNNSRYNKRQADNLLISIPFTVSSSASSLLLNSKQHADYLKIEQRSKQLAMTTNMMRNPLDISMSMKPYYFLNERSNITSHSNSLMQRVLQRKTEQDRLKQSLEQQSLAQAEIIDGIANAVREAKQRCLTPVDQKRDFTYYSREKEQLSSDSGKKRRRYGLSQKQQIETKKVPLNVEDVIPLEEDYVGVQGGMRRNSCDCSNCGGPSVKQQRIKGLVAQFAPRQIVRESLKLKWKKASKTLKKLCFFFRLATEKAKAPKMKQRKSIAMMNRSITGSGSSSSSSSGTGVGLLGLDSQLRKPFLNMKISNGNNEEVVQKINEDSIKEAGEEDLDEEVADNNSAGEKEKNETQNNDISIEVDLFQSTTDIKKAFANVDGTFFDELAMKKEEELDQIASARQVRIKNKKQTLQRLLTPAELATRTPKLNNVIYRKYLSPSHPRLLDSLTRDAHSLLSRTQSTVAVAPATAMNGDDSDKQTLYNQFSLTNLHLNDAKKPPSPTSQSTTSLFNFRKVYSNRKTIPPTMPLKPKTPSKNVITSNNQNNNNSSMNTPNLITSTPFITSRTHILITPKSSQNSNNSQIQLNSNPQRNLNQNLHLRQPQRFLSPSTSTLNSSLPLHSPLNTSMLLQAKRDQNTPSTSRTYLTSRNGGTRKVQIQ